MPDLSCSYFLARKSRCDPLVNAASNTGIGNLMLQAQAQFQVPLIFAGLIALAVEGIAMYALMAWLETRMTGWAQRSGFAQA